MKTNHTWSFPVHNRLNILLQRERRQPLHRECHQLPHRECHQPLHREHHQLLHRESLLS
jgi:hypothetical protein